MDLLLLLTHIGGPFDKALAKITPGLDAILGGHDHKIYRKLVIDTHTNVLIHHSGSYGKQLGIITFTFNKGKISERNTKIIDINDKMPQDSKIQKIRKKYFPV